MNFTTAAERQTIQEIHDSFDFDLRDLLREINGETALLAKKPQFMPDKAFLQTVDHFRQHYPQNNFITERQVGEICRKYNLVMGPAMLFTAEIPERNRREIDRFALRREDSRYKDAGLFDHFLHEKLARTNRTMRTAPDLDFRYRGGHVEARYQEPTLDIETEYFAENGASMRQVIPVGDGFVLIANDKRDGDYDLYAKVNVQESEWMLHVGTISVWTGAVRIDWQHSFAGWGGRGMSINRTCRVSMHLPFSAFYFLRDIDLSVSVSPMIVAPGTMFDRYKDAVETRDGYRLRFKEQPTGTPGMFRFYLDDPIVLQPVPGGYLVVTKWGLEANIPEVQNGASN